MEDPVDVRVISQSEVLAVVSMKEAIEVVEQVWRKVAQGLITLAGNEELIVDPPAARNRASEQRASIPPLGVFGVKWGTNFLNRPQGTALHYGIVILNDARDGKPVAMVDSRSITTIRTGANAAVAAKYLAQQDSRTLAILGCGQQGRSHLSALATLFRFETVRLYDVHAEQVAAFIRDMEPLVADADMVPASSAREAVADANVVCMVTAANEPLVMEAWIPRGCFVCGTAQFRDLDVKLAKTADKFVVGYRPQDSERLFKRYPGLAGWISPEDIYADTPDLAGGKRPGRENDEERILYVFTGYGVLDVAIAHLANTNARARGMGVTINLSPAG